MKLALSHIVRLYRIHDAALIVRLSDRYPDYGVVSVLKLYSFHMSDHCYTVSLYLIRLDSR